MKKYIILSVSLFFTLCLFAQETHLSKQKVFFKDGSILESSVPREDGSLEKITGNFIAEDINGIEHNLERYLHSGKGVFVDISTVGCYPCWILHESHVLKVLHNTYGPGGTNEIVVLFVEPGKDTDISHINGTATGTLGDWTDGGTIPYPIIIKPGIENIISIDGYPYPALICPDGTYKDTWGLINEGIGTKTTELIAEEIMDEFRKCAALSLTINTTPLVFYEEGGSITVPVTSSINWEVTTSDDWLTISDVNGNSEGSFLVSAQENSENEERSGKVTVTGEGGEIVRVIDVSQLIATAISEGIVRNFRVYPNPANDVLNVVAEEGTQITITNSVGQQVRHIITTSNNEQISLGSLEPGTYFIRLIKDTKIFNEKIILLR